MSYLLDTNVIPEVVAKLPALLFLSASCLLASPRETRAAERGSVVTINADQVLVIDGRKVFPIGFTMPPLPGAKAPNGKGGIEELRSAGATFLRTGVMGGAWDDAALDREEQWENEAARNGMHCWVFLREAGAIRPGDARNEAMLRRIVSRLRNNPGLGVWKGADEPEWGKEPIPPLARARAIVRELDPNHPIALTHAPRGTVDSLRPYNAGADITGADIYPIGYPPGTHSLLPNKEASMVGDYTQTMMRVADGKMPVWMILQIAWSGVIKPGKTLRFPTFAEERFMTYQAIVNGARGLIFFGGHLPKAWDEQDAKLGWNWHFWNRVLRPVVEEIGDRGPLYPALVAPNSKLPIAVAGADDIEFCVREVGDDIFLLACKREGPTARVEFNGLPASAATGEVLYEAPRKVKAHAGRFTDWFAPHEVHVYRFRR